MVFADYWLGAWPEGALFIHLSGLNHQCNLFYPPLGLNQCLYLLLRELEQESFLILSVQDWLKLR